MENQERKKTVIELLFLEFKVLSNNLRFAGDESSANLIDLLCERETDALREEQEQLREAYDEGCSYLDKLMDEEGKLCIGL